MNNPIAVSTWSLHHHLGYSFGNGPGQEEPFDQSATWGPGRFDLFQLPVELAARGYSRCEICHFHIGSLQPSALHQLAEAFAAAGVVIQTLLIDDGDLTKAETLERDAAWIAQWIDAAAMLKAENARVIAGKSPATTDTLAMSVAGLKNMVAHGEKVGVRVVTENWHDLLATPAAVHHVLDHVPGLGFMADTGNWSGPSKYDDLASIFARADLCHAKAAFSDGLVLDEADFANCLRAAKQSNYQGPMTLIFSDDGDEWRGLDVERLFVRQFDAA